MASSAFGLFLLNVQQEQDEHTSEKRQRDKESEIKNIEKKRKEENLRKNVEKKKQEEEEQIKKEEENKKIKLEKKIEEDKKIEEEQKEAKDEKDKGQELEEEKRERAERDKCDRLEEEKNKPNSKIFTQLKTRSLALQEENETKTSNRKEHQHLKEQKLQKEKEERKDKKENEISERDKCDRLKEEKKKGDSNLNEQLKTQSLAKRKEQQHLREKKFTKEKTKRKDKKENLIWDNVKKILNSVKRTIKRKNIDTNTEEDMNHLSSDESISPASKKKKLILNNGGFTEKKTQFTLEHVVSKEVLKLNIFTLFLLFYIFAGFQLCWQTKGRHCKEAGFKHLCNLRFHISSETGKRRKLLLFKFSDKRSVDQPKVQTISVGPRCANQRSSIRVKIISWCNNRSGMTMVTMS